jgi:hypothetical protein
MTLENDKRPPPWLDWRETLATALAAVRGRVVAPADATRTLLRLPPVTLLELDRVIRVQSQRTFRHVALDRLRYPPLDRPLDEIQAFAFLHACDANGHVREAAIDLFARESGDLALAAALLRCGDWVPTVRNAAIGLLSQLLEQGHSAALFTHLDLLLRLRAQQRFADQAWIDRIEPALRDPRHREARHAAAWRCDVEGQLFVLQLMSEIEPESLTEASAGAVLSDDPRIALWAVRTVRPAERALPILDDARRNRHAAVRAAALRRLAALDAPDLQATLEAHCFDTAREPRNAAAWLLRERCGVDARVAWRAALDGEKTAQTFVALDALREHATADDVDRVTPFLAHRRVRCRVAALDALVRIGSPGLGTALAVALRDQSPRVVRNAIRSYRIARDAPSASLLREAYANAANDDVRQPLAGALDLVGKWDALELVLDWCGEAPSPLPSFLHRAYLDWHRSATGRYGMLDATRKACITMMLARAKARHPAVSFAGVDDLLRFA